MKQFLSIVLVVIMMNSVAKAELLDHIVAVVEEDIILERELSFEVQNIVNKLKKSQVNLPPAFVLRKQVLERLILEKLQRQLAQKAGVRISDEMLRSSVQDIARRNNLTVTAFREELKNQGIDFKNFKENLRNEIIINQLRAREIGARIKVTDREIKHYLETQGEVGDGKIQFHLGHILVSTPEGASSTVLREAKEKAEFVVEELREGGNFQQTAVAYSDSDSALNGGDLGWRTVGTLPTLFVDTVPKMKDGEVAPIIRSPSGYHVIKLLGLKGVGKHIVTKTKARHILIKTNELTSDDDAQKRLTLLRNRIIDGDDFATLARSNSADRVSALNGGALGWVGKGDLVPPFEAAMNKLADHEISKPVQTQFGWHIIQVLERQKKDGSDEHKKTKVRDEIRKRKIEEETELWLRRLRDEAFVDIKLDRL
ncbi:MAG: peptidylprolyl isomerase [Methylococcales bacterium]|nr:peptidylprolyl isomerase [Methylococcales bacterium]